MDYTHKTTTEPLCFSHFLRTALHIWRKFSYDYILVCVYENPPTRMMIQISAVLKTITPCSDE